MLLATETNIYNCWNILFDYSGELAELINPAVKTADERKEFDINPKLLGTKRKIEQLYFLGKSDDTSFVFSLIRAVLKFGEMGTIDESEKKLLSVLIKELRK